jgi:hypothetical protein
VTDLLDRSLAEPEPPRARTVVPGRPPVLPVVMSALGTVTSLGLVVSAVRDGAGSTDEVSSAAVLAWLFGSVIGLLLFAWFGLLDARERSSGHYVEPRWRPRAVMAVLTVASWLSGAAAAVLVAQAVARR